MRFKHRDQQFNENWNAQKNANRDAAHSRQMERDAAGHDVTMRGQDLGHTSAMMGHSMTGRGQDFQKEQWGTANQLARDNLNQQGQQWEDRAAAEDSRFRQTFGLDQERFMQGAQEHQDNHSLKRAEAARAIARDELSRSVRSTDEYGNPVHETQPGIEWDWRSRPGAPLGRPKRDFDDYFERTFGK